MNLKEKLALKAAEKLLGKISKEDFLAQLKQEIGRLGLQGDNQVDAAVKRIEESGLKHLFTKLGITREDIEEAYINEKT